MDLTCPIYKRCEIDIVSRGLPDDRTMASRHAMVFSNDEVSYFPESNHGDIGVALAFDLGSRIACSVIGLDVNPTFSFRSDDRW